ncbi:MAG TPA: hypothetical protein VFW68_09305 [Rhodocyclaceae bacterium]|nr:hypothetical protein [Rhodocyclaceae bacterium]
MRSKGFVIVWLAVFLGGCLLFAGVNYYVDPLWLFTHENRFNQKQWGFDERQQKTNLVRFGSFDYDALLLGSSRSTYISQASFFDSRVFNYAVSGMRPVEFPGYIDFALSMRKRPFERIYLGMDFFATNKKNPGSAERASRYVEASGYPLYRLESLLSYDTFGKSITNIKKVRAGGPCDCYDRHNVKTLAVPSPEVKAKAVSGDVSAYNTKVYGPDYLYDDGLKDLLIQLRDAHSETRFIVFTTPPSYKLFQVLVRMGRLPDYERWITEMVDVFGGVYDFMGLNSITENLDNYADGHHFYQSVGTVIAARLENREAGPKDFGTYVTRDNLARHLASIRAQARRVGALP